MGSGIDDGLGRTNIDKATGIRYGVIPASRLEYWYDEAEADYGDPTCPECGCDAVDSDDESVPEEHRGEDDYYCSNCEETHRSDESFPDTPQGYVFEDEEYTAHQGGDDSDVFVIKSPYYTRAQYCSPCAPGACYLLNPDHEGDRAYCFGHDAFEGGHAPYPVFSVETGEEILPPS